MSLEAESCYPEKPPRRKCTTLLRKMGKLRLKGVSGESSSRGRAQRVISRPLLVQDEERMEGLHCTSR